MFYLLLQNNWHKEYDIYEYEYEDEDYILSSRCDLYTHLLLPFIKQNGSIDFELLSKRCDEIFKRLLSFITEEAIEYKNKISENEIFLDESGKIDISNIPKMEKKTEQLIFHGKAIGFKEDFLIYLWDTENLRELTDFHKCMMSIFYEKEFVRDAYLNHLDGYFTY